MKCPMRKQIRLYVQPSLFRKGQSMNAAIPKFARDAPSPASVLTPNAFAERTVCRGIIGIPQSSFYTLNSIAPRLPNQTILLQSY